MYPITPVKMFGFCQSAPAVDFLSVIIEPLFAIGDIEFITKKLLGVFEGV